MKISNIPLINEQSVPEFLKEKELDLCHRLNSRPDRLVDLRKK